MMKSRRYAVRNIQSSLTAYSDEVGRVFRPEVGHRADVKRATYSDAKRAIWDAPAWVVRAQFIERC